MKIKLQTSDFCVIAKNEKGTKIKKTSTTVEMFTWLHSNGFKQIKDNFFENENYNMDFERGLKDNLFNMYSLN